MDRFPGYTVSCGHGRVSGCSVSGEELGRRDGTEGYGSRGVRRCGLEGGAPGGGGEQSGSRGEDEAV